MGEKKQVKKLVAGIRGQLGYYYSSGLVIVPEAEMSMILDRLEKLEKREAKRKAHDASVRPTVLAPSVPKEIEEGDRVELVEDVQTVYWPFLVKGAKGTVTKVIGWGSHTFHVAYDDAPEKSPDLWTKLEEIRKVA